MTTPRTEPYDLIAELEALTYSRGQTTVSFHLVRRVLDRIEECLGHKTKIALTLRIAALEAMIREYLPGLDIPDTASEGSE